MNMHESEPIAVIFDSEGALYRFHWRGVTFRVEAIERIRRTSVSQPLGRRLYTVRAGGHRFLLCHDRAHHRWTLIRSPWRLRLRQKVAALTVRLAPL